MANMNVAMSLTLTDTASAPLRSFMGVIEQLQALTNNLAPKLDAVAASVTNIGRAAEGGAAGAQAMGGGLGTLDAAAAALGNTLTSLATRLGEVSASMVAIGTEAAAAGAAVNAGTANMGAGLSQANTQANTLMTTLKGLGELYVALKVEQGLKASVGDASKFQNVETELKGMNLGAERTAEIMSKAWDDSKINRFASALSTLEARLAAIGGMAQPMDDKIIDATLPSAMRLANNLSLGGDKTDPKDMVRNLYGMAEARGQTEDADAMKRTFDLVQQASIVTGGKITARDWENFLRQLGSGASQISDEGLYNMIGVLDQIKVSGGGGASGGGSQRAATAFKMLQAYGLGKPMNKQGARMFEEAGLFDTAMMGPDNGSGITRNVKAGSIVDSKLLAEDPVGWVIKEMPRILASMKAQPGRYFPEGGLDDPKAVAVAIQKWLASLGITVTAQQALGISGQEATSKRVIDQANMAKQAKGVDDMAKEFSSTYAENVKEFKGQLENLAIVMGATLLPALTLLAKGFSDVFEALAQFFKEHPIAAEFATWGAAIGAVALAISGFAALFGALGLGALFSAVGTMAVTAFGMAGTAIAALTPILLPVIATVGSFFAAWEFGSWLANLEVGGKAVRTWGADLIEFMVNAFTEGWNLIGGTITKIADTIVGVLIPGLRLFNSEAKAAASVPMAMDFGKGDGWGGDSAKPAGQKKAAGAGLFAPTASPGRSSARRGGGGRRDSYNPDADLASNLYKIEEDNLRSNFKVMDALYKEGNLSIENYYIGKQAALEAGVEAEERALNAERAAYIKAGNMAGVNRVDTQLAAARNKLETGSEQNKADFDQKNNQLMQTSISLNREMMATSGERHRAEIAHLAQEEEAKTKVLVLNGKITQEQADSYLAQVKAKGELALRNHELAQIQETYAEKNSEIDEQEKLGYISRTSADEQKYEARKAFVALLDAEIERQKELALLSKDDSAVLSLEKLKRKNLVGPSPDEVDQATMLRSAQGGFDNFFKSILNGTKSVKDAFRSLGASIIDTINGVVAKRLGDALFDSLFGKMVGSSSSSSSSAGGLLGWLGGLFGGGSSGASGLNYQNGSDLGFAVAGSFASGIDYVPNDMIAQIHKGERVMTAAENANYSPQGRTQVNNINVSPPAGMTTKAGTQLAADIARQISAANRRNN